MPTFTQTAPDWLFSLSPSVLCFKSKQPKPQGAEMVAALLLAIGGSV